MKAWGRCLLQHSPRLQENCLVAGCLLLVLATIAFAGASFTFDEELRPQLRQVASLMLAVGGLLFVRGQFPRAKS